MAQVLLINPAARPSKTRQRKEKPIMAKKQRTAAQKAATRKLVALNKSRSGGSKGKRVSRAKPASKRQKTAKTYAISTVAAPKRRKARRSHPITSARTASDAGRKLRYRRANPIGFVGDTVIPAAVGGGGALMVDVLLGVLPLPATLKTGAMAPLVKVAAAVGLGYAAKMVVSRKTAEQLAAGAITVTLYNVAKGLLVKAGKGKIPGLSEYVGAYPDALFYDAASGGVVNGMGEFVSGPDESDAMAGDEGMDGDDDGMGYPNAGMVVGELMPDGSVADYDEEGVYR